DTITKTVTSITGGTADGKVDSAGDVIHYSIDGDNSRNASLTGATANDHVDFFADTTLTLASGDTHNTGVLDVDATWTYIAAYTVTQADIDNNGGGDGIIHNVATFLTNPTPPQISTLSLHDALPISDTITKTVTSITGGTADGKVDSAGDVIHYS